MHWRRTLLSVLALTGVGSFVWIAAGQFSSSHISITKIDKDGSTDERAKDAYDSDSSSSDFLLEDLARINASPRLAGENQQPPRYDVMRVGVLQHVDRDYTYDIIPAELQKGILFQGVHRVPEGTAIQVDLSITASIYVFFHPVYDGGYGKIFEDLEHGKWKRCESYPQYDIHGGRSHGRVMIMYKLAGAEPGYAYRIPPTTEDRGCISIVVQPVDEKWRTRLEARLRTSAEENGDGEDTAAEQTRR